MPISTRELDHMTVKPKVGIKVPPFCSTCGYDLTGCPSPRCPECGDPFVAKEWRRRAGEVVEDIKEINEANRAALLGMRIGMAALTLSAIQFTLLRDMPGLRVGVGWLALTMGTISLFLGLGPLRVNKLPSWAKELSLSRDVYTGFWAAILGAMSITFCLL